MDNFASIIGVPLSGDFVIVRLDTVDEPMIDAAGRKAIACTHITGKKIAISIRHDLSEKEMSVTLYHEILEALTVGCDEPPSSVLEYREGDFEREAYAAFEKFGTANPDTLRRMLQSFGFS